MKCDCCRKAETKEIFKLPVIGYGSLFDCLTEEDRVKFSLCPDCAKKINRWIHNKNPEISLEEFWKCNIIKQPIDDRHPEIFLEEFEYEYLLWDVFKKFMPTIIYGEHYIIPRFLDKFRRY